MPPAASDQEPEDDAARAESVWFAAAGEAPDGQPDLAQLCALHPELADELRAVAADWAWLEGRVGRETGEDESDGAELKQLVRGLDPARYTRLEELAEGGGGRIERIWDALLRRSLALKVAKVRSSEERASKNA